MKKSIVLTFGRANPITAGHGKLFDKVASVAKKHNADYRIHLSQSQDAKKNPLDYKSKVKYAKMLFPKYAGKFIYDTGVKTFFHAVGKAYDDGYTNLYFVVGSDRVNEFRALLNKYNGKDFNFDHIEIISAGERDPDADGVTGISASKMRAFVSSDDFKNFKRGLPKGTSPKLAQTIFNSVKAGMGL